MVRVLSALALFGTSGVLGVVLLLASLVRERVAPGPEADEAHPAPGDGRGQARRSPPVWTLFAQEPGNEDEVEDDEDA